MKEFLFVFRANNDQMPARSEEEQKAATQRWMDWIGNIADQGHLADRGKRLYATGKVMNGEVVTNGPYVEIKETIGGYSLIKADNYEAAVALAKDCPILLVGGSVEIREVNPL